MKTNRTCSLVRIRVWMLLWLVAAAWLVASLVRRRRGARPASRGEPRAGRLVPPAAPEAQALPAVEAPAAREIRPLEEVKLKPAEEPKAPAALPAAKWKELEPTDASDPVPHQVHLSREGAPGWALAGASRRGKMHAHQGSYREDAFAFDVIGPWHLAAVSDGAGSARLSRVGSRLAVEAAVTAVKRTLAAEPYPSSEQVGQALDRALRAAHAAVCAEAKRRERPPNDLAATFLFLVHGVVLREHVVGAIQVGDGLIAVQCQDGSLEPLAERDSGTFAGETYFLTSRPLEAWLGRGVVRRLEKPPQLLVAMTDGVADDFFPYGTYLAPLFKALANVIAGSAGDTSGDAGQALLDLIGYEKRGSFDDRTVVMIYQQPAR